MSSGTRAWYRSLYWRIALGLVAFLALMLAAQGLLFIFLTDRLAGSMPARSPRQLATLVASDLSATLSANPSTDIYKYIHDQYDHVFQPIIVAMRDGRTVSNHDTLVPEELLGVLRRQAVMGGLPRRFGRGSGPGGRGEGPGGEEPFPQPPGRGDGPDDTGPFGRRRGPDGAGPFGLPSGPGAAAGLGPRRRADFEPIVVNGERVGVVAVPLGRPPFTLIVQELGPTMGLVGIAVLVIGGTGMAFVVFGPARRRLLKVQEATERIGAGDLAARAPDHGGDEVAHLARSFNRMAEDLAARAHALDISDQARRQLLADVSHELMTPLTAMRGYIETLSMKELALDSPTRERYLAIVDEETRRLERIIGDLLDLARLEGGGPGMRVDVVSVANLFDRVATRHERELLERRVTLRQLIEPGADTLQGDQDRLEQALQNLAGNALRHTPDGGEISLSATVRDRAMVLSVRDSGPGIPAAHLPLIFDRFYKVDSSRRAAGGSGLGLSIVRAIVERHGGTITARNDGGAVFEITLPRDVRSA